MKSLTVSKSAIAILMIMMIVIVILTFLPQHHICVIKTIAHLSLIHIHGCLVEESCVPLISEETLLLSIEKHVPNGKEKDFAQLEYDEQFEPGAFLLEHGKLVYAIFTRG